MAQLAHNLDLGRVDRTANRAVIVWLFGMAALVFAMVVLGGVTRLTQSGLSIVEWRPLVGVIPPIGEEAWQALFAKYQQFPEYQKINRGMTLAGFREIFWLEYTHRLLGRAVGVVFVVPFLWFLIRRQLSRGLIAKLLVMFVLGGAQGLLGWYMVKSGLVDEPDVSPYRLAAHLGLAVVIYAYILWTALGLLWGAGDEKAGSRGFRIALPVATGLVFLTILSGAFVAGNDAGFAYNTFPLMAGAIVPPDIFLIEPAWRNFFENVPLVQLTHRLAAMLTVASIVVMFLISFRATLATPARTALYALAAAALGQFVLGIATLLTFVPIPLGAAHQAGAMVTFTAALITVRLLHPARR